MSLSVFLLKVLKIVGVLETTLADGSTGDGGKSFTLVNPLVCGNFACIATAIIKAIFTISIPITSIMVLVGGFQILTAAGDEEKFKTGRKTLLYAVIGFAVILISGGVVSLIQSLFVSP